MMLRSTLAVLTAGVWITAAAAQHSHGERKGLADKHAPAGLMGDHLHERGEWMVEYKYMNMYMEDNRIGDRTVSDAEAISLTGPGNTALDGVVTNRGATPTEMTMEMHMVHVMYGATDDVTLYTMLMLPSLTMDHLRGPGNPATGTFTTHNSGFGDTSFGALMRLYSDRRQDWIFNLGCSVPTGDIFRETDVPTAGINPPQALPYPMRLGSGTFNFRPGLTYKRFLDWYSWGAQFQTDLPIGRNYRGYSVSDEFRLNSWVSVLMTDWLSLSWRNEHLWRTEFDGEDPATNDLVISTNVEAFRGGYWYSMGFGAQANLKGHYFNAEIVPTIAQDLDGIQLETDFSVVASYSKAW